MVYKICPIEYWLSGICQYGKDYEYDAPVKLLDKHLHAMVQSSDEQLVVVSQVSSYMMGHENFYLHRHSASLFAL